MAARVRYLDAECPTPFRWSWIEREHRAFHKAVEQPIEQRLVWIGSSHTPELAGYLCYLDWHSELPAEVVRPDDYLPAHPKYGPPGSISILNAEQIADVLDNAPRRPVAADKELFDCWSLLRADGAYLRIANGGKLASAPVDYFDRLLLGAATAEWTRQVRVVGYALSAAFDERMSLSDWFLFSRLGALVRSGQLEAQGDVLGWTEEGSRAQAMVRKPVGSTSPQ